MLGKVQATLMLLGFPLVEDEKSWRVATTLACLKMVDCSGCAMSDSGSPLFRAFLSILS